MRVFSGFILPFELFGCPIESLQFSLRNSLRTLSRSLNVVDLLLGPQTDFSIASTFPTLGNNFQSQTKIADVNSTTLEERREAHVVHGGEHDIRGRCQSRIRILVCLLTCLFFVVLNSFDFYSTL